MKMGEASDRFPNAWTFHGNEAVFAALSAGGNVVPGAAGRPHLFAAIGLPEKRQRFYRKEHLYPAAAGDADVDAIQYSHGKNDMVICGIRSQKGTSGSIAAKE